MWAAPWRTDYYPIPHARLANAGNPSRSGADGPSTNRSAVACVCVRASARTAALLSLSLSPSRSPVFPRCLPCLAFRPSSLKWSAVCQLATMQAVHTFGAGPVSPGQNRELRAGRHDRSWPEPRHKCIGTAACTWARASGSMSRWLCATRSSTSLCSCSIPLHLRRAAPVK